MALRARKVPAEQARRLANLCCQTPALASRKAGGGVDEQLPRILLIQAELRALALFEVGMGSLTPPPNTHPAACSLAYLEKALEAAALITPLFTCDTRRQ